MSDSERFRRAIEAFDRENAEDPVLLALGEDQGPRELVRARALSVCVARLNENASEALRLAARCQHIRRWEVPRSQYEPGRAGYLKWRKALARRHAEIATRILTDVGYDQATIERVRAINLKKGLRQDADVQTMEDALCLTFVEHELAEFATKHDEDKVVDIIKKTWKKMSERGRRAVSELELPPQVQRFLVAARSSE